MRKLELNMLIFKYFIKEMTEGLFLIRKGRELFISSYFRLFNI